MPTDPLDKILNRDFAVVSVRELIDRVRPLLQEFVNNGTRVFRRCESSARGAENDDFAALMLYYHILQTADGIEVLVCQSCVDPAVPLVRSLFEAMLQLEYILEKPAEYTRRSVQWVVCDEHRRISGLETFDPATQRGREFREAGKRDQVSLNLPAPQEVQAEIQPLLDFLKRPELAPIDAEYQARKKARPSVEPYSLFGGPDNLRELAHYLSWGAYYDVLYSQWSEIGHALSLRRFIRGDTKGRAFLRSLRDPTRMREVADVTSTLLLKATRLLIEKFRAGEDLSPWYLREIKPLRDALDGLRVDFVDNE